ncbi:Cleavage and polyadenylation specificity factor (CPSF) A subunit protein [Striga hermonthica]|uniref:Cleavage and polyadenylation specificity factor (CPSF) A subunit protein n=1 Tax=Striga hermonthica TaxID=68872 RepID=A0A9N7MK67_STRHE|nr:Cleavage and polyadenylation specificity factor (CPSF) A subunit protein [Striga hermonthica]
MAVSEEESSSASSSRPHLKNDADAFYLAKTVLRGSVIIQALCGHFRFPTSQDVVLGKETSIELVIIDEDGIVQSISEQPVFGTIKDLAVLPWNEKYQVQSPKMLGKDMLLVISDSGKLSFLTFCNEMHRFLALSHVQISGPGNSRHQVGRMLAIDSSGSFIAVSAYEDQLAIFSLSMSQSGDFIDKKIFCPSEKDGRLKTARGTTNISGTIWSMCFISQDYHQHNKACKPVVAILLNRWGSFYRNELLLLEWNIEEQHVHVVYQFAEAGPLAYHIVEVPHLHGFAFLFRAGDIVLMDFRNVHSPSCVYRTSLNISLMEDKKISNIIRIPDIMDEEGIYNVAASALLELGDINKSDDPMNIDDYSSVQPSRNHVCSWSWEPSSEHGPRIIFSIDSGELYAIEVLFESDGLRVNLSDCLYKGLPSNALLWLDGGFVAAIVDMADGMVLKFEEGFLQYKSPIQNIAPVLDMCIVDYPNERHDQMFVCSGMASEGSLRIIRSGISVEKLLKTAPIYQGVTDTWTIKMKFSDPYHSFLVLSFVEETRVLSVGLCFYDVTESVGFQPDVCTLACGIVADGVLVQIHHCGVKLCLPAGTSHSNGTPLSSPVCTSWLPDNMTISLGAVGHDMIVVATSSPCFLFILGVRSSLEYNYEVYPMHCVKLQNELSCISIPRKDLELNRVLMGYADDNNVTSFASGNDYDCLFVIGTHKPSVEVVSFTRDKGLQVHAIGIISLMNTMGTTISGCVPQDVRLVLVDHLYVLSGLRNGMLLRFEWPSAAKLSTSGPPGRQTVASSSKVDLHVLSDSESPNNKVFLYKTCGKTERELPVNLELIAVRRIGITPVFLVPVSDSLDANVIALSDRPWLLQSARHSLSYTSISFQPSTHATPVCSVECLSGILFVADNCLHLVEMVPSKRLNVQKFHLGGTPRKVLYHNESRLLLVMRTELDKDSWSSDVCFVDPLSGAILSSFKFEPGETGKCMEFVKVGNEYVLVIGTSLSAGPAIMPSGEAESTKGRLVVLCLEHMQNSDSGSVTLRNSPGGGYAAEQFSNSSICSSPDDNNSCDGIKLEETEAWHFRLAFSTPWPGMVIAVCPYLDRYFLASADNVSPERNLTLSCSYYMGEIAMSMRKGSFSYKLPADDMLKDSDGTNNNVNSSRNCIMASTLLGSIVTFIPVTREEYELLKHVQARLVENPLTAPILGNDHSEFRSRESRAGITKMLDGDILVQFLELTSMQQQDVLTPPTTIMSTSKSSTRVLVNQVVRLLERVHYAVN